jgi:hypothetical protein
MREKILFLSLRQRLLDRYPVPEQAVSQVPPEVIWTAYTTCYQCATRLLTTDHLAALIADSADAADFLQRLDPLFVALYQQSCHEAQSTCIPFSGNAL